MLATFIYDAFSLRMQLADIRMICLPFYIMKLYTLKKIMLYNFHLYDTWTLFESFAK